MGDGLRLAFGTLSVLPVQAPRTVDRTVAGRAMVLAPLVGLVLGGISAAVVAGADRLKPEAPLLSAVLGIVVIVILSGALHLDGLADTADGFGSRRDRETKLRIMKQSDIGPFGVVSIAAVLLIDVAALHACIQNGFGWQAMLIAGIASRLTLPWSCRTSIPSARPDGLGAMVAGTVRPYAAGLLTLASATIAAVLGWLTSRAVIHGWVAIEGGPPTYSHSYPTIRGTETFSNGPLGAVIEGSSGRLTQSPGIPTLEVTVLGSVAAVLIAVLLTFATTRRTRKSLGGITGDTLGATVELAFPLTLLALAFTT